MLHVRLRESTFVVGNASAGESARRKPRSECNRRSAKSRKHGIFRHFGDFPSKKQKTCPCVTEHLAVLQDSGRVTKVSWVAGFA